MLLKPDDLQSISSWVSMHFSVIWVSIVFLCVKLCCERAYNHFSMHNNNSMPLLTSYRNYSFYYLPKLWPSKKSDYQIVHFPVKQIFNHINSYISLFRQHSNLLGFLWPYNTFELKCIFNYTKRILVLIQWIIGEILIFWNWYKLSR